jgi:hypothetical protein
MKVHWIFRSVLFVALPLCSGQSLPLPSCSQSDDVNGEPAAERIVSDLRSHSFPEVTQVDIRMRTFHSQADYFRTRFSLARFFSPLRMRYFVEVNPALFRQQAPPDGVCAVLAHELVHGVTLSHGNRIRRLSLVRLLSKGYTAQFERRADLEAIHRGYGDGLKSYRTWVYDHIPPNKLQEKLRNYFSPKEIAAIQMKLQEQPDLFAYWSKHVPSNLGEIQSGGR